ncbi:hypothetical protein EYC80_011152 [Monilinia laxa]|uniref:Uncharacterized protein n=1 Tax=Monilinia laxa TaxID=61186 RepID=A0A5N6JP48_MONLA|nr:hypothetical protein EYC80_011152 [Monilinia laxa]
MDTAVAGAPIPSYEELCCKSKAYRAMSYLPYTQPQPVKMQIPRTRSKKGAPLDPDDLSRRLRAYIAEEKALAEHRQTTRVSMATGVYHHVPQVAALSFDNTATQEKLRQVHRLSEPALKNYGYLTGDEGIEGAGIASKYAYQKSPTILQKAQGLDHASAEKTRIRNRNQYQWTAALERAAELDAERDVYRCARRTFISDAPEVHKSRAVQRPMSMGDLLGWEEKEAPKEMKRNKNDRHDWTQRDESEEARRSMRKRVGPLLSLKLRKEKVSDGAAQEIKLKSPVKSPLRASFFGRFKRSFSNGT